MKKSYITGRNHDFYDKGKAIFDRIQVLPEHQTMAATPHAELIAELMNPNNPKNEREHAAVREIERLQEALAQPVQPAPQRQPLTDAEIWQMVNDCSFNRDLHADKFARAIEAAHGIGDKT